MVTPEAVFRPSERVVEVNGSTLHYWVYDEGSSADSPVIVMVHGLRGTHHGMEPIIEHLPGRRVVVPDLPGFGDSAPMEGHRHDVEGYASTVSALIDELGEPVVLLGHSFGSLVVAHLAASAPELVNRLILVNPISTPALEGTRGLLSELTARYYSLGKLLPARAAKSLLSNRLLVLAASRAMTRTKDKRVRRFVDENHLRYFSEFHSPAVVSETFEASVSHTVLNYAEDLTVPVLLIAGETDEIAPLAGQRALAARLSDAELAVIADVGHLVHYETPRAAAGAIERFIAT